MKKTLKNILYILLFTVILSCKNNRLKEKQPIKKITKETYYDDLIEIVKVRDCEYVLWLHGYGGNMNHYEGCTNPKHCN